jgi:tetratricopeptide (TPR) repeat protein
VAPADHVDKKTGSKSTDAASAPFLCENYEILEQIGAGAMSRTYRGRDKLLSREVAIKVLDPLLSRDPKYIERFQREARCCSELKHPNIVQIFSFGVTADGLPYIVMELLEGQTLGQILHQKKTLTEEEFSEVFVPVLDAISYAHEKKIVHRDLKPDNIMLCQAESQGPIVKILDFGIARCLSTSNQDLPQTVATAGTPMYMSPESWTEKDADDYCCDVYSLACMMYESIVGEPPFFSESLFKTMYRRLTESMPTLSRWNCTSYSRGLLAEIRLALSTNPLNRPQDAVEFRRRFLNAMERGKGKTPGRKQLAAAVLAGLLAIVALLAFALCPKLAIQEPPNNGRQNPARQNYSVREMAIMGQARTLVAEGEYLKAIPEFQEAIKRAHSATGEDSDEWLYHAHCELADTYLELKMLDPALREFDAAADIYPDPVAWRRIYVLDLKFRAIARFGNPDKSAKLYRNMFASCEKHLNGEADQGLGKVYVWFADSLMRSGKKEEGLKYVLRGLWHFDNTPSKRCLPEAVTGAFMAYDIYTARKEPQLAGTELRKTELDLPLIKHYAANAMLEYAKQSEKHGLHKQACAAYADTIEYAPHLTLSPGKTEGMVKECKSALSRLQAAGPSKSQAMKVLSSH